MSIIVATVVMFGTWLQYQTYFSEQKNRLFEAATQQSMLMDAVARFDLLHSENDHPDGAFAATLAQIIDAQKHYMETSLTDETLIASLQEDDIVYKLRRSREEFRTDELIVPLAQVSGQPMMLALKGESGIYVGPDQSGTDVLAAYVPVKELGLGLVTKTDVQEIRAPFIKVLFISSLVALILIVIAALWFIRIVKPLSSRLQESEALNRTIVDSATDAILTIDETGVIRQANHSCKDLFGYSTEELVGNRINMLMPEAVSDVHDQYLLNAVERKTVRQELANRELVALHKSGSQFPISLSLSRGEISGHVIFTGIVRDITDIKEYQKQLVESKEQAEKANKAKSIFISNISHELRTPLNAIIGFSQLLEEEECLDEEMRYQVKEINSAGFYLLELINDILDLAKVEADKFELNAEEIMLNQVVNDSLSLVDNLADKNSIVLGKDLSENDFLVKTDARRLKQVLINLLTNGIKYNDANGHVMISIEGTENNSVRIAVSDNGFGIDDAHKSKLFTQFSRFHQHRTNIEGTGIGLVIAKLLVEKMGGTLGFTSELNIGSKFWIELPYIRMVKDGDATREEVTQFPSGPISRTGRRLNCLYIEDKRQNYEVLQKTLSRHYNADVKHAMNACDGIALAKSMRPDVIFLDINLPGIDGYETANSLKRNHETASIPIVAVSAYASRDHIERAERVGFSDYLTKPLETEKLHKIMSDYLVSE